MTATDLESRVQAFIDQSRARGVESESLRKELAQAIFNRITELYEQRDERSASFELWLSWQFNSERPRGDMFEFDPELEKFAIAVDQTQVNNGRSTVARMVNEKLLAAGHEFGINRNFVDIELLTGRRLGHSWSGNAPTN